MVGTKYDPIVTSVGETVSIPLMELYREAHPARVLAEVAAKRRILERHSDWNGQAHVCPSFDLYGQCLLRLVECDTLKLMAEPYADHKDYDPAWRVE
jgi:hypothetical protein